MRESERINYDEQLSSTPSTNASPHKLLAEAYQQNNGNKDCSVDPYGSMKYDSKDGSLTLPPKCPESPVDKLIGLPALTGSYKDSDDGKTRQFAEEHGAFIVFDNNTKAVDALGINAKTVVVSENSKFDYMDGQFLTF